MKSIGTFPDNATLKIYEGPISDKTLVTSLTKANYKSRLPMELKNTMRQYVLNTGVITDFIITRDMNSADWNQVYDGRKGFIHSFYYGCNSNQQDTDETFVTQAKQKLFFNYIVRDADFSEDQISLTVTVMSNGQQVFSDVYNSKNLPPTTTNSIQGDKYNIKYKTHGTVTKGFRIDFSTTSTGYVTGSSTTSTTTSTRVTTTNAKLSSTTTESSRSVTTQTTVLPVSSTTSKLTTTTKKTTKVRKTTTKKSVPQTTIGYFETTTSTVQARGFIIFVMSTICYILY